MSGKFRENDRMKIVNRQSEFYGMTGTILFVGRLGYYTVRIDGDGTEEFHETELKRI